MNAPVLEFALPHVDATGHDPAALAAARAVVIVGGGPAGIRAAQELARRGFDCSVVNAERWQPYNRVKLTSLLCGDAQLGQVVQPLRFDGAGRVALYSQQSVVDIDRERRIVTTSLGKHIPYDTAILAMGSRAHVPPIPGVELPGVLTFRNADDVERLVARSIRSRRTIVVGGGLLGLEAARGMATRGVETIVVEHEQWLMARQLDRKAGQALARQIEAMGIAVRTGVPVAEICGVERVQELRLRDGTAIAADTVILCTGIRANIELARAVGLAVGRGITVDATMRTSDPHIFAVGECAEFNGSVFGLVGPAFEQAVIAARCIAGDAVAYVQSTPSTKLKVAGADVLAIGDVEQIDQRSDLTTVTFESDDRYRRVVLKRGRLVGAIAIGPWDEATGLQDAVRTQRRVLPWQRQRFRSTGQLWPKSEPRSVREWPRSATVCNCTGVTRGQIGDAIALGACTLDDVRRDTGASTVCGSCKVHIAELFAEPPKREPIAAVGWHLWLSAVAALAAFVTLLAPTVPLMSSITERGLPERLWLDGTSKQVSGYGLLTLAVVAGLLSLRKRVSGIRLGRYSVWRIIHLAVGALAVTALFAHTGFRLGSNLNAWLMTSFLSLAIAGAITGLVTALEHRLPGDARAAARLRQSAFWVHLSAAWPLPLLLAMHIATVYFY